MLKCLVQKEDLLKHLFKINKIKNNEIKIEDDDEDDEKELEIRISDNQAIEKEIGMISKKERKREKEVTCCL